MDIRLRLAMKKFSEEESSENAMRLAKEMMRSQNNFDDGLEIEGILFVSTGHITEAESEELSSTSDALHNMDEYGYLIHIPSIAWRVNLRNLIANSPNLQRLTELAILKGCDWLKIDRDTGVIDSLPVYDW